MKKISDNLYHIHQSIEQACAACGRSADTVTLLCVSKTKPAADIIEAYQAGERHFGESYANEAGEKIPALKDMGYSDIIWHFIGPVQSNKTRIIAEHFDVVESVDRIKTARRLNEQRPAGLPPLQVLVQVNISAEEQKSGCSFAELPSLIDFIQSQEHLRLRGLMGIARETDDHEEIRHSFTALAEAFKKWQDSIPGFDTLSIGMTQDMAAAIACGSTEVRIGTAIFGPREYKNKD